MSKKQKTKHKFASATEVRGDQFTSDTKCRFCHQPRTKDILQGGRLYQLNTDYYHYFCLLFSKLGVQRGKDEEGLNGFLTQDIKKEVDRGKSLKCDFCHKPGATIPCSKKGCSRKYHFPCGAVQTPQPMQFIFINQMDSFCEVHGPKQSIKQKSLRDIHVVGSPSGDTCMACLETSFVDPPPGPGPGRLVSPCCGRTFHRDCIQKTAIRAGKATFKCPNCKNKAKFCAEMEKYGIYIPHADAEWEMAEDSNFYQFDEMLHPYMRCDAVECSCPRGRENGRAGTKYEIVKCETCGQNGSHIECGQLSIRNPVYVCKICENTESSDEESDDSDDEAIREALKRNEERQEKQKKLELEALERNRILEEDRVERNKRLEEEVRNILAPSDSEDDDVIYVARVPRTAKILNALGEPMTVVHMPNLRCGDPKTAPPYQRNTSVGSHLPFNIASTQSEARTAKFMPRKTGPVDMSDDGKDTDEDSDDNTAEDEADIVTLDSDDDVFDAPALEIGKVISGTPTKLLMDTADSDDEDIVIVDEVLSKRERTLQEILEELARPTEPRNDNRKTATEVAVEDEVIDEDEHEDYSDPESDVTEQIEGRALDKDTYAALIEKVINT